MNNWIVCHRIEDRDGILLNSLDDTQDIYIYSSFSYPIPYTKSLSTSSGTSLYTLNICICNNDFREYYRKIQISSLLFSTMSGSIYPSTISYTDVTNNNYTNVRIVDSEESMNASLNNLIAIKCNEDHDMKVYIGIPSYNIVLESDTITCSKGETINVTFRDDVITKIKQLLFTSHLRTLDINIFLNN